MEDRDIVTLYWQRDQEAIRQTDRQYGRYLSSIAFHILADREDSRETVNDTYLRAWDSMPPHRPQVLATYLGRITRQLSIDRWRTRGRAKRGGSQYALSLEELGDCVSGAATPEEALDLAELGRAIGDYLRTLPLYYETEHYICVHAAISCKGLEHTDRHTAIWDRKLVLYGHTPTEKVFYQPGDATCKAIIAGRTQPLPERGCIGLDTGCVARNKLTAMVIEENKPGGPVYQLRQVEYGKR